MKLWQKDNTQHGDIEKFTIGDDQALDMKLAPYDVLGSLAHVHMLQHVGLVNDEEGGMLKGALREIYKSIETGNFQIQEGVEDVHSQVELLLTHRLGDSGKKIHSARSRNDQVLVDVKMLFRAELKTIVLKIKEVADLLLKLADRHQHDLLPGYTHFQLAMPSSFGLWFAGYAEALSDDLFSGHTAYSLSDRNPLGSAAGYGSSFPIDRTMTTRLLGFKDLHYNVINAQMARGKTERAVAQFLANVAHTLSKLSCDAIVFMNPHFGFISFPDHLTTGSSIMPHKKNPDVFELIRAHCNLLLALPNTVSMLTANLVSGYHRDLQLLKTAIFPAFDELKNCLDMMRLMLSEIAVKKNILASTFYDHLFSVEEVNKLVLEGVPFRDAYRQIGHAISSGEFAPTHEVQHTHEGSIGNLCLDRISKNLTSMVDTFAFSRWESAFEALLSEQ